MNFKKFLSFENLLIIILFILFCYLFIENFVFSESYEMTQFRLHPDDQAFNYGLQLWQHNLKILNISDILCYSQYAYGWIFWALHGIITFPFFLLNMEQMTISTTRNISLVMSFATLYFIYKIIGTYTRNQFYKMLVILLVVCCDYFIFFSLTFDTTAMIRFFGILSIYFIVKDKSLSIKTIILSSLCIGISVATKLVGGAFMPIIMLLLFDRLKNTEKFKKIKKISLYLIIFLTSAVIFTNPGLLLIFSNKNDYISSMEKYNYFKESLTFIPYSDLKMYFGRVLYNFYGIYLTILLISLYILKIIDDSKKKKFDFIYYFIGTICLPILFFFIDEEKSDLIFIKYYAITMVLLPFSIIQLSKYKKIGYTISVAVLILLFYRTFIFEKPIYCDNFPRLTYNRMYENKKFVQENNFFTTYEEIKELMKPNENNIISYCSNYYDIRHPYFSDNPHIFPCKIERVEFEILNSDKNYNYYIFFNYPFFLYTTEGRYAKDRQVKKIIENDDSFQKIYDKHNVELYAKKYLLTNN